MKHVRLTAPAVGRLAPPGRGRAGAAHGTSSSTDPEPRRWLARSHTGSDGHRDGASAPTSATRAGTARAQAGATVAGRRGITALTAAASLRVPHKRRRSASAAAPPRLRDRNRADSAQAASAAGAGAGAGAGASAGAGATPVSRFRGVGWHHNAGGGCWVAATTYKGRTVYLGSSASPEEAARLVDCASEWKRVHHVNMHGHKIVFNFPHETHEPLDLEARVARARVRRTGTGAAGFRGVRRNGGSWAAQITYKGRQHSLGGFPSPEAAARQFDRAAEWKRVNNVDTGGKPILFNFPRESPEPLDLEARLQRGRRAKGASGYRGVRLDRGMWRAFCSFKCRFIYLGAFSSPEEAARRVDRAAEYKRVNNAFTSGHPIEFNFPDERPEPLDLEAVVAREPVPRATGKSGYRGVKKSNSGRSGTWKASVGYKGRCVHLGSFASAADAARQVDRANEYKRVNNVRTGGHPVVFNFPDEILRPEPLDLEAWLARPGQRRTVAALGDGAGAGAGASTDKVSATPSDDTLNQMPPTAPGSRAVALAAEFKIIDDALRGGHPIALKFAGETRERLDLDAFLKFKLAPCR